LPGKLNFAKFSETKYPRKLKLNICNENRDCKTVEKRD